MVTEALILSTAAVYACFLAVLGPAITVNAAEGKRLRGNVPCCEDMLWGVVYQVVGKISSMSGNVVVTGTMIERREGAFRPSPFVH